MKIMRYLILILSIIISITAWAELAETKDAQISHLERLMARISQESQSTYQQFLMTQELRREEMLRSPDNISLNLTGKSIPIPSYDDLIERRKERDERMEKYATDLDRLYRRYRELEAERQAIFEKIKFLEKKPMEE